jgi:hypothetical protein
VAEQAKKQASPKAKEQTEKGAGEMPFGPEVKPAPEPTTSGCQPQAPEAPQMEIDETLSGTYEIREMNSAPTLKLKALQLKAGQLVGGQQVRFIIRGNEAEFQYDPNHDYFETSLDNPSNCLVRELAYQLLLRSTENQEVWPLTRIEQLLRQRYFAGTILDIDGLTNEANELLDELREFLMEKLPSISPIDQSLVSPRERDDIRTKLIVEGQASEENISEIISSGQFPKYLGRDFQLKALNVWPNLLLDGNFFSVSYATVTETARQSALEQVMGPLRDVVWLCHQANVPALNKQQWREQLARAASSLRLLQLWRA